MQRVSTAFVGQVSAASSPAVAKLKGRARATNNSAYVPLASSHRAQRAGVATLVAIFLEAPVVRSFAACRRGDRIKIYPPYRRARS